MIAVPFSFFGRTMITDQSGAPPFSEYYMEKASRQSNHNVWMNEDDDIQTQLGDAPFRPAGSPDLSHQN
jgi:hypothetical protein